MENRYEWVQNFMEWHIKDNKEKRRIAVCGNLKDAEQIAFVLNEFEKSKYPESPKDLWQKEDFN